MADLRRRRSPVAGAQAMATLAETDPIKVALELSQARDQVKAAFVMVRHLVGELGGGPITIPPEAFIGASKDRRRLHSEMTPDGGAIVELRDR